MILNYAEVENLNRAIIALDQEKAYDKIAHDYMWKVLFHCNFPPPPPILSTLFKSYMPMLKQ